MTAPLTIDQIEDAEEFFGEIEHWRRVSYEAEPAEMQEHKRCVTLVRLVFADAKSRAVGGRS